jgi:lysozyme
MTAVPAAALDLIRRFEGRRLAPYHDCVGFPTVGYGRLLSREKGADLSRWPAIGEDQAEAYLAEDAADAARSVTRLISVPLGDGRFAALVDFVFNLGGGQLQVSTLRRVINRGDLDDAPVQLLRWCHAGGVKLAGLARRRAAEVEVWRQGA